LGRRVYNLEAITKHSADKAAEEAVVLWSFASTQFPKNNSLLIEEASVCMIEVISTFALNARRVLEYLKNRPIFLLSQKRWRWEPTKKGEVVSELWDALNRIIHAKRLVVGFESLPDNISVIDGGAVVILYIQAETDRRELAFIDPFALAHAYLYEVYSLMFKP
jgi:hypothetical protein